jgi:hypothetical protein
MSTTTGRGTVTAAGAAKSRGETSKTGTTAHPAQAERSGRTWIEAYLERLEGKELRETFYERLEDASFSSS